VPDLAVVQDPQHLGDRVRAQGQKLATGAAQSRRLGDLATADDDPDGLVVGEAAVGGAGRQRRVVRQRGAGADADRVDPGTHAVRM
jgi:hypothetical protein